MYCWKYFKGSNMLHLTKTFPTAIPEIRTYEKEKEVLSSLGMVQYVNNH